MESKHMIEAYYDHTQQELSQKDAEIQQLREQLEEWKGHYSHAHNTLQAAELDCECRKEEIQQLKEEVRRLALSIDKSVALIEEKNKRNEELKSRISELESQQQKGIAEAWVSVGKEKPERLENLSCSDVVLCYESGRNYTYPASYDYKYRQWFMNAIQQPEEKVNPTHWRELPQPPIESVKDESKH